ncbi:hypothetical protein [Streptomyces sp. JJ38]|uniref:hypothetical protein n=1 Tax=Streptomyces sp. JJ38 TaxID=2738128 RepID=UPI001C59C83B|nr:hypothetical protein [Streptomyces sp. JJ38]MBW1595674.1 hypothetical protein [Streptomyces sp. JJ38]
MVIGGPPDRLTTDDLDRYLQSKHPPHPTREQLHAAGRGSLHTLAGRGPLTGKQVQQARDEIRLVTAFLDRLADRGRSLANCTQADVDAWNAAGYTARAAPRRGRSRGPGAPLGGATRARRWCLTHASLRWAMRSKHMPKVVVSRRSTSNPAPLAQHQRLALLRQLVNRDDVPLQDCVAAVLVLLYA